MLNQNICKIVPVTTAEDVIHTFQFVYETERQIPTTMRLNSFFRLHYVASGRGILHTNFGKYELSHGMIFFTFPSENYALESLDDFKFLYISYIGIRANSIKEQLGIQKHKRVFSAYEEIENTLFHFLDIAQVNNLNTITESALLYIFAVIEKNLIPEPQKASVSNTALRIKTYINEHYQDPNLSLHSIGRALCYNEKYISGVFKKQLNVTIGKYITLIRIQNACALMEKNLTCVKDIASICGFSDPLYFSKVFKKINFVSPQEYIKTLHQKSDSP